MNVDVVRTINNQMVIGKVIETSESVMVLKPYSLIPTKEGLTLIPYDIDLTGYKMEEVKFKPEHVLYVSKGSETLAKEYVRILEGKPKEPVQETQETQEQEADASEK